MSDFYRHADHAVCRVFSYIPGLISSCGDMETPKKTAWWRKRKLQSRKALLRAAKLSKLPPSLSANEDPLPPCPESPEGVRETPGPTGEPQEGTSLRVCDPVPSVSLYRRYLYS